MYLLLLPCLWWIKDYHYQLKQGEHNAFEMLPNGSCLRAYETSCSEAARHASGWSMRNTNNHNTAILKKSCLGVLVCSRRHTTCPSRPAVHLKPAICHKARAKQIGQNIVFVCSPVQPDCTEWASSIADMVCGQKLVSRTADAKPSRKSENKVFHS